MMQFSYLCGACVTSNVNDERIAGVILDLCAKRGPDKTICPSEAACALSADHQDWRGSMDDVRRVASDPMQKGHIDVTQQGQSVSPLTAKGPIRFRLSSQNK